MLRNLVQHTAILDVDKDTSIFGVYDGHGGVCITHLGRNFFSGRIIAVSC